MSITPPRRGPCALIRKRRSIRAAATSTTRQTLCARRESNRSAAVFDQQSPILNLCTNFSACLTPLDPKLNHAVDQVGIGQSECASSRTLRDSLPPLRFGLYRYPRPQRVFTAALPADTIVRRLESLETAKRPYGGALPIESKKVG